MRTKDDIEFILQTFQLAEELKTFIPLPTIVRKEKIKRFLLDPDFIPILQTKLEETYEM